MIHALFATYAITLDGKTVLPHARALVVANHVLLPVRALGNAVGADIAYDPYTHVIIVQRGAHVARLIVNCRGCVVHGTTYAPLRQVASAFALRVGYQAATRTVALTDPAHTPLANATAPGTANVTPAYAPPTYAPAYAPAARTFAITVSPPAGGEVHEPYPLISARFAGTSSIDPRSLRVRIDDRDVTADAAVIGDQVLVTPRTALAPGTHVVSVVGRDSTGAPIAQQWSFVDSFTFAVGPAPTPYPVSGIWIDRWVTPGTNAFDVFVAGVPGMTGYVGVDGVGNYFPLQVYTAHEYVAHVLVPDGVNQPFARVAARITFPNGQTQTIVLPQTINLSTPLQKNMIFVTPTPVPTASPAPRVVPIRRSVDIPSPTATPVRGPQRSVHEPTPSPKPTPLPTATPAAVRTPPARVRTAAPLAQPTPTPAATPEAAPSETPVPRRRLPLKRPSPTPSPTA